MADDWRPGGAAAPDRRVFFGGRRCGGGAGVGAYAYVNGELTDTVPASLDRAWSATLAAMKDMQMPVLAQAKDALQGELTARNASDKKISVNLKKVADNSTEVRIRVGTFGDEAQSQAILYNIKSHLPH